MEGGARGVDETHALTRGGVEHPRGDRDSRLVRCATHEHDLPGPADLAVEERVEPEFVPFRVYAFKE
jgi:hypothetical protein